MDFAAANLDELRSVEELAHFETEVSARIRALDEEYKGQPLPDDVRSEWAALKDLRDGDGKNGAPIGTQARIKELNARAAYVQRLAGDERHVEKVDEDLLSRGPRPSIKEQNIYDLSTIRAQWDRPDVARQELRDRAMRAVELARYPELVDRAKAQEHIARMLDSIDTPDGQLARHILTTGNPTYRRAFVKRTVASALDQPINLSGEEERAFSLSTTGIPITFALDPTLIPVSSSVVNPLRAISNVEQIVGTNEWRGVTAAAITASRVAEATEATDNAPTLAQPAIVCSKVHAFVPFSIESNQDWPGMESGLARLFADAKDDEEATSFATGNGTPPNPFGVLTGATGTTAAATGLTITAANLYSLEAALAPRFRPRAQFVANRAMYNIIRALDTAGGAQLWLRIGELIGNAPASSGGNGNTGLRLLGYAVNELSTMSATVVNGTKIMLLGDFSMFKIIDRVGMTVELVPHIFGATARYPIGQRGLYAYWRNGSKVIDAVGFRALTGTT